MFELLAEPVRKYIRDKRWEALRPIQNAAIQHILTTDKNFILASRTASGKTEAAFLPILSKVDFNQPGVKVLYISPLIALINDQFLRVEELCQYLDVPVTKWHGEANKTLKQKLLKEPAGIVLITPESLEAMFVNAPANVNHLFGRLEYVVIDEIHSFIGTDRGVQLKSILSRLQQVNVSFFKIIGLSATIGDYTEAKEMTGDAQNTTILRDKTAKRIDTAFKFFHMEGVDLPLDLLKDLYLNTKDDKVLIFPNSRGRAEEIAVKLKKISDRVKGHPYYFSHHSSVDKELREYIENFVKNNRRYPFAIACTSTLELGIDIGSVDKVVQVDATSSIASLIQRLGRSGRKDHQNSSLLFYATDPWSLLQSLACLSLYREEVIEPVFVTKKPYDVLLHQILSIVKQLSGCTLEQLLERLLRNFAFTGIKNESIRAIIQSLADADIFEIVGNELIIGIEGEKIVNTKDFYTVFKSEPNFKVIHQNKTIGEIPLLSIIQVDENILLAAKIWKVVDIDFKAKKITVMPAHDGNKPRFVGSGADVHPIIRQKMLKLLKSTETWPDLDEPAAEALRQLKHDFLNYPIENYSYERPILLMEGAVKVYTFQGTVVNRSLHFVLALLAVNFDYHEQDSSFKIPTDGPGVHQLFEQGLEKLKDIDTFLSQALIANPGLIEFSKWGRYLPLEYQCRILKEKHYDFGNLEIFLQNLRLVPFESNAG